MPKMGHITLAVLAGAFLLSWAVPERAGAQSGRGWMKGFVVDESDVHGIPGARVELTGDPENPRLKDRKLTAAADDRGEYSFPEVPYGRFIFRVSAPGFAVYEVKIYILSDSATIFHVSLDRTAKENSQG